MSKIKQIRYRLRMTQAELALEIGVNHGYISHLESGRRSPSLAVAHRLKNFARANHIRCSLEDVAPDPALMEKI